MPSLASLIAIAIATTPLGASPASSCESPAVCTEAVCQQPTTEPQAPGAAYLEMKRVCPPDRNDIGRAMWTMLHTMAAHYPPSATDDQQRTARAFLTALPELFPCKDCGHHLASALDEMPPRLETREAFVLWVCELHNHVNSRTGKAARPCTLRELDETWHTPSQACLDAREKLKP